MPQDEVEAMVELEDFLAELEGWQTAYPLRAFPEPDLKKAAQVLKANGMTLDAISASNMRHVVERIAPKAAALLTRLSAQLKDAREALTTIEGMEPVTCEMTLAHDMADVARAALKGSAPTATEEEGHRWVDNDKGGQDNVTAMKEVGK